MSLSPAEMEAEIVNLRRQRDGFADVLRVSQQLVETLRDRRESLESDLAARVAENEGLYAECYRLREYERRSVGWEEREAGLHAEVDRLEAEARKGSEARMEWAEKLDAALAQVEEARVNYDKLNTGAASLLDAANDRADAALAQVEALARSESAAVESQIRANAEAQSNAQRIEALTKERDSARANLSLVRSIVAEMRADALRPKGGQSVGPRRMPVPISIIKELEQATGPDQGGYTAEGYYRLRQEKDAAESRAALLEERCRALEKSLGDTARGWMRAREQIADLAVELEVAESDEPFGLRGETAQKLRSLLSPSPPPEQEPGGSSQPSSTKGAPHMTPTIGRIVHYSLTEEQARQVASYRAQPQPAGFGGNPVAKGTVVPMIITDVWPNEFGEGKFGVNGQVLLDGNDSLWVTSAKESVPLETEGGEIGTWWWPPKVA